MFSIGVILFEIRDGKFAGKMKFVFFSEKMRNSLPKGEKCCVVDFLFGFTESVTF